MTLARTAYQRVQTGSREDLVIQHAALVKRIAWHLAGRLPAGIEVDDLVQAGMIGLLEAASCYQPDKGASFETFAGLRIRGAMLDQLRREGWAPRSVTRRMRQLGEAIRKVEHRHGREAQPAEVARELGIGIDAYHEWLQDAGTLHVASLDELAEHGMDAVEQAAGTSLSTPLDAVMAEGFQGALAEEIDGLPEREKLVLALYYDKGLNLKEIGKVLEISESRVCQIHSQAVVRLRSKLSEWAEQGLA